MQFKKFHVKKVLPHVLPLVLLLLLLTQNIDAKSKYHGFLGVGIDKLTKVDKEDLDVEFGVLVTDVEANSPAGKAGIMEDDVIQYYKGDKMTSTKDLIEAVRETEPETKAQITLVRDGQKKDVYAVIGKKRERILHKSFDMNWTDDEDHNFVFHTGSRRGFLGVQLQNLNKDLATYFKVKTDEGVLIVDVVEDSPAEEAKIKAGDVIVMIDNEKISQSDDVVEYIGDKEEGDEVLITLVRKGRKIKVKASLDEHKAAKNMMLVKSPHGKCIDITIPDIEVHTNKLKMNEMKLQEMEDHLEDMDHEIIKKEIIINDADNI